MVAKSMTMNQAAAFLGKSRRTMYYWNITGTLSFHHVGARVEYNAEEVVRTKFPTLSDKEVVSIINNLP